MLPSSRVATGQAEVMLPHLAGGVGDLRQTGSRNQEEQTTRRGAAAMSRNYKMRPPSTTSTVPVTNLALARYQTAATMSSGLPLRCNGASRTKSASHSGGSPGMVMV